MQLKTSSKKNKKPMLENFEPQKAESNFQISVTESARKDLSERLGLLLADTYALYLKTQNFHWNVKGARFMSLHQLFETQYLELAAAVDLIAERIRALGYLASATFSDFLKMSALEEGNGKIPAAEMIRKLMNDHQQIAKTISSFIPKAETAEDQATMDLFGARIAAHEKAAWMLRSLFED